MKEMTDQRMNVKPLVVEKDQVSHGSSTPMNMPYSQLCFPVTGATMARPDNMRPAPPSQQPSRPLPAVANIYGSDLSAAAQCANTDTDEDEDEELVIEFSRAGDDEPNNDAPQESTPNLNATGSPRSGKPSWLPSAYVSLRK